MFDFKLVFTDGVTYDVKNVQEIAINYRDSHRKLSGDDILSMNYPPSDMCLYTPNGCIAITGKNLLVVDIRKQDI